MTDPPVAALILALALPVTGCGGGDDEADEFRDDYTVAVERLNEVSSDLQEEAAEALRRAVGSSTRRRRR